MKALRPKMGDKAAQKELMGAIKDPEIRAKIVGMIASSESGGAEAAAPAPAEAAAPEPPPADSGGDEPAPPAE